MRRCVHSQNIRVGSALCTTRRLTSKLWWPLYHNNTDLHTQGCYCGIKSWINLQTETRSRCEGSQRTALRSTLEIKSKKCLILKRKIWSNPPVCGRQWSARPWGSAMLVPAVSLFLFGWIFTAQCCLMLLSHFSEKHLEGLNVSPPIYLKTQKVKTAAKSYWIDFAVDPFLDFISCFDKQQHLSSELHICSEPHGLQEEPK